DVVVGGGGVAASGSAHDAAVGRRKRRERGLRMAAHGATAMPGAPRVPATTCAASPPGRPATPRSMRASLRARVQRSSLQAPLLVGPPAAASEDVRASPAVAD